MRTNLLLYFASYCYLQLFLLTLISNLFRALDAFSTYLLVLSYSAMPSFDNRYTIGTSYMVLAYKYRA